ncbi:hypothetical protein LCGC14_2165680 [marine sediment metagenome]|uniref:Uncharacterized protein n=1 Tax=marine sediment metagenome TaxID=412755 RepID=A0A0F9DRD7_9ZZZZ
MKKGFRFEIQKDLNTDELKLAIDFANEFISDTCKNNMKFSFSRKAGYRSYIRRGCFGYRFDKKNNLVFRRISTKSRIFGIIKPDTMVDLLGKNVNLNQCMCPIHLGGVKVRWKSEKPDMNVYAIVGDIKG